MFDLFWSRDGFKTHYLPHFGQKRLFLQDGEQVDHVFKPSLGRKTLKQGKMKGNHVFKPDLDLLEESLVAPRPLSLEAVDSFTIPCNDDGS